MYRCTILLHVISFYLSLPLHLPSLLHSSPSLLFSSPPPCLPPSSVPSSLPHSLPHSPSLLQFTMMSMSMFKEIFTELIDYLVERIQSNYALQIIPNSFLANSTTSPTFASILLNFLLKVSIMFSEFIQRVYREPNGFPLLYTTVHVHVS